MGDERVLGHLARRFSVSTENIATEALTWLLQQSPSARLAVIALARSADVDLPADLHFIGQVGNPETGRPDIVGTDDGHRERLLIEAKFAAALTEQQPSGYLQRLPDDEDGILLVVAPTMRISVLWSELLTAAPGDHTAPAPSTAQPPGQLLHVQIAPHRTLALVSWRTLVTLVIEALRRDGQHGLGQDGEQLLALTEQMDAEAYVPLRPGDLDQATGRHVQQLQELIDGVHTGLDTSKVAKAWSSSSHGRIFYGWYARSRSTDKRVWFGFLPRAWSWHGITPLWMLVEVDQGRSRQTLLTALAVLRSEGGVGLFDDHSSPGLLVPLMIPSYAGPAASIHALLRQLEKVVALLDAAVPDPSPTPLVPASS